MSASTQRLWSAATRIGGGAHAGARPVHGRLAGLGALLMALLPAGAAAQVSPMAAPGTASVSPQGGSKTVAAFSTGNTVSFTVTNTSDVPKTYDLQCSNYTFQACTLSKTSVSLLDRESTTVTATFAVGAAGSSTLALDAFDSGGGGSASGWYNLTITEPTISVSPTNSPVTVNVSSSGTATFRVTNQNGPGDTFTIGCNVSAPVAGCTPPAEVFIGAGASATVAIGFSSQSYAGTGTVTVSANGKSYGATGGATATVNVVAPPAGAPVVTPDGGSATFKTNQQGASVVFSVHNPGGGAGIYNLTCTKTGAPVQYCNAPTSVSVPAGSTVNVTASLPLVADAFGPATITLNASLSGVGSDNGSYNVYVEQAGDFADIQPRGEDLRVGPGTIGKAVTFTVRNTSPDSRETIALGCIVTGSVSNCNPQSPTFVLEPNASTTFTATFNAGAAGTTGVIDYETGKTAAGWYNVRVDYPPGTPVVTADNATLTANENTSGNPVGFQVGNSGDGPGLYTLDCTGTGAVTDCTPSRDTLQVGGHETLPASFTYSTGAAGGGTVVLVATGTEGQGSDTAVVSVTVDGPPIVVADAPAGLDVFANPGGIAHFTVTNPNPNQIPYSFDCATDPPVSTCSPPSSVSIAGNGSITADVSFITGATTGTGAVRLIVTGDLGGSATASTTVRVNPPPPLAAVTPDFGADTADLGSSGNVVKFAVRNTGTISATYALDCLAGGGVTFCAPAGDSITVAAGATDSVAVTYTAGLPGSGQVILDAVLPGYDGDAGHYDVIIFAPPVVTATGTAPTLNPGASTTLPFRISNPNSTSISYSLACPVTGVLADCTGPTAVSVGAGASLDTTVQLTASATTGTGTATLIATGSGGTGSAAYAITVSGTIANNPIVSPQDSTRTFAVGDTAGSVVFAVKNGPGAATTTFDLTCQTAGATIGTSCGLSRSAVTLQADSSTAVTASFSLARAAGQNTVTLQATESGGTGAGTGRYTVITRDTGFAGAPSVSPDSMLVAVKPGTTGNVATFYVWNRGTGGGQYSLTCTASGFATDCSPGTETIIIPGGDTAVVQRTYATTSTPSTGTVTFLAGLVGQSVLYSGTLYVTPDTASPPPPPPPIAGPGKPEVILASPSGRDFQQRGACVTVGAGPNAGSQCGHLIVTHSMPAYRTLDRDHVLTLLYNSATAKPYPIVMADVALPAGVAPPDSLRAELRVGGTPVATYTYGADSIVARARRIALGYDATSSKTGAYAYSLSVTNVYIGKSCDSCQTVINDTLLLVNRSASNYGRGWSVAGLDELVIPADTSYLLLVQGDGSAALYRRLGQQKAWGAPRGAYRDTIVYAPGDAYGLTGSYYQRTLLDRTRIFFNPIGLQRWVIDPTGARKVEYIPKSQTTPGSYIYQIKIPPLAGTYTFSVANVNPIKLLSWIDDPSGRRLDVTYDKAAGTLTSLSDVYKFTETYTYVNGLMDTRTLPSGGQIRYDYAPGTNLLAKTSLLNGTPALSETSYRPVQLAGLKGVDSSAPASDSAVLKIDGPRNDVPDSAFFAVNRLGAPTRIRDALGHVTSVFYDSLSMPLVPTRIIYPNTRQVSISYDALARVDTVTDLTHSAGPATTAYSYTDPNVPDKPTIVDAPREGSARDVAKYTYNADRTLKEVVDPLGHKTGFQYTDARKQVWQITEYKVPVSGQAQPQDTSTVLGYDDAGRGNLLSVQTPAGTTNLAYDAYGNVTRRINPTSDTVRWHYDEMNRPDSMIVYDNGRFSTTFKYNQIGNLIQRVDPINATWRWEYDRFGLDTVAIDNFGHADSMSYDLAGNLIRVRNRQGDTIKTTYDALNRPLQKLVGQVTVDQPRDSIYRDLRTTDIGYRDYTQTGAILAPGDLITYDYDAMGNPTLIDNRSSHITRQFNLEGTLKTETQALKFASQQTATLSYTYTPSNARASMSTSTLLRQASYTYTHGPGGLLDQIVDGSDVVTFAWDSLGRRSGLTLPNGTHVTYGYDASGRMARIVARHPAWTSGALVDLSYSLYDAAGRVRTLNQGSVQPGHTWNRLSNYDHRGQLVRQDFSSDVTGSGSTRNFAYDSTGNRLLDFEADTVRFIQYPGSSRLRFRVAFTPDVPGADTSFYTYDENGAMIREHRTNLDKYWPWDRYYDALGRLVRAKTTRVVSPSNPFKMQKDSVEYFYDGLGRRVGSRLDGGNEEWTFYDGSRIVGVSGAEVLTGPGVDEPLALYNPVQNQPCGGSVLKFYYPGLFVTT